MFCCLLELGDMPSCAVWWRATTAQAVATLLIIDTVTLKWMVSAFNFFWPSQRCWLGFGGMLLPHGGIGLGSRWKEAVGWGERKRFDHGWFMVVLISIQMLGFCCLDHAWMLHVSDEMLHWMSLGHSGSRSPWILGGSQSQPRCIPWTASIYKDRRFCRWALQGGLGSLGSWPILAHLGPTEICFWCGNMCSWHQERSQWMNCQGTSIFVIILGCAMRTFGWLGTSPASKQHY